MPGEKKREDKTPKEWERRPERTPEESIPRERQEQGKTPRRSEETARKQ